MIKLVETPPIALYQSITGTSTSAIITPYPTDLDGVKLTYTDFGDTPTFTIDPGVVSTEEIISFTGITDNGDGTATLTGLTRNLLGKSPYTASSNPGRSHGATAVIVFSDNPQVYSRFAAKENNETITGVWTFSNFPVTPPSLQFGAVGTAGIVQLSAAPLSPTVPIAVSTTDTSIFAPITAAVPTGTSFAFNGRAAPSGYVLENGQGLAAASFPALFAVLYTPATVSSITIGASALVTTSGAHGFVVGDQISFTTTGGLPSGLTTGVNYWIISSGFTTTAFELATAKGGPAITTSGSQSGVHTAYLSNTGPYNGTTFYVPDMRSKSVIGAGQGTAVWTFDSTLISYNQVATFTNSSDVISTSLANNLKVGSRVEFSRQPP